MTRTSGRTRARLLDRPRLARGPAGRAGRRVADPGRPPDGRPARRVAPDASAIAESELRGGDPRPRPAAARPHPAPRRDRRRRGVHGRPVVDPRPPGAARLAALNRSALALTGGWWRRPAPAARGRSPTGPGGTRASGSRRNIAAHYDLGNDFYRLFLDETMTYSSAVFETAGPVARRRAAQQVPAHRGAAPASGAGSTSSRSARAGAASRSTRPASWAVASPRSRSRRQQHDLATERVRAAGLEDLVDVQLRDYRDIEGTYDAIVSIEMLEAVGAEYLRDVLRGVRSGAAAGRPAESPGRSPSRTPPTSPAPRRELDPDLHLPGRPVPVAGGHRAGDPRTRAC